MDHLRGKPLPGSDHLPVPKCSLTPSLAPRWHRRAHPHRSCRWRAAPLSPQPLLGNLEGAARSRRRLVSHPAQPLLLGCAPHAPASAFARAVVLSTSKRWGQSCASSPGGLHPC